MSLPLRMTDGGGALTLYEARPATGGDCPLVELRDVEGAIWLYQRHHLLVPLIATVFAEETPIVTMVGWQERLGGEQVAVLERIVGHPTRPPGWRQFAAVDARWGALCRARGLRRTITFIAKDQPKIAALARRYRWVFYAEEGL